MENHEKQDQTDLGKSVFTGLSVISIGAYFLILALLTGLTIYSIIISR